MKHILYIVDFYKPNKGGIEVLLEEIVGKLSKSNKISILTWNFNGNLPEIERKGNITIYRVKSKNLISYIFKGYKKAKKIIYNIDIVHGNTYYSAIITGMLAKKYKNKKFFIHVHGLFGKFWENLIEDENKFIKKIKSLKFRILEKFITKQKVNKFIAISYFVRDVLHFTYGVKLNNIEVIHNGLDYKRWKSYIKKNEITKIKKDFGLEKKYNILFFGRIEKLKGWDFYLETIPLLNLKNTNYIFIIHGDLKKFVNKLLKLKLIKKDITKNLEKGEKIIIESKLNKSNKFILIPGLPHKEIANWIKASNLVVIPSLMEPFGLVGLETSILKTPIVASNSGALHEVVFGNINFYQLGHIENFKKEIENSYKNIFQYKIYDRKLYSEYTIKELKKLYIL